MAPLIQLADPMELLIPMPHLEVSLYSLASSVTEGFKICEVRGGLHARN